MNCLENTLDKYGIDFSEELFSDSEKYSIPIIKRTKPIVKSSWMRNSEFKCILSKQNISFIEQEFLALSKQWKKETKGSSSSSVMFMNKNYLQIIGMGEKVLPYIFNELYKNGGHWFVALNSITKINPVPQEDWGNIPKMRIAWLKWAKENSIYEF
jgi:hypothetical protein